MEDKRLLRLVKRARIGNKNAFSELINEKSRKIVFIATNLMGNRSDGEDAAQEAVIMLAKKIGSLKNPKLFDAWMYRIIFNVCMDEKRKKARMVDSSAELETAAATVAEKDVEILPQQNLEQTVDKETLMAALNELPDKYRFCMILYYYEDMSYAEIAETLQVSEQVVANTLNRAKEKLRMNLEVKDLYIADEISTTDSRVALPATAVKAGVAALPAALIANAIAANEAAIVLPSSLAAVSHAAAAVSMPAGLLLTRLADSVATKAVAGATAVAVAVGGLSMAVKPPEEVVTPEPEPEPIEQVQEPVQEEQPVYQWATVEGLPDGASTTTISVEQNPADLEAFKSNIENYTFVTSTSDESYVYNLYQSNENELEYVLTIEAL